MDIINGSSEGTKGMLSIVCTSEYSSHQNNVEEVRVT